jgi:hypothetical protein
MDFGGFILFIALGLGLLVGGLSLVAAFRAGSAMRWRALSLWFGGLMLLAVLGRRLHQVYWLDEKLFVAAARGDAAEVKALLSAGASPNADWEDGTTALSAARSHGHHDVVILLEQAGASR